MPNLSSASCNIGGPEVRRRKSAAIFSAILTIITGSLLLILDAPRDYRLVIFVPVIFTVIGWYQTKRRFCLAYGMAGVFNLGELGRVENVTDPVQRKRDKSQVFKTIGESILISAVVTLLFFLI